MLLAGVRQLSIRQQNTKHKAATLPLYIYKKDSNHGQEINLFESLVGTAELPSDDQPVVIIMNKGSFVLLQNYVQQLTEHKVPPGAVNIIGKLHKDYQDGDVSITADVYINSSPFPLMFRMIESNMIIPDTFISHQIPNPNFDPDS